MGTRILSKAHQQPGTVTEIASGYWFVVEWDRHQGKFRTYYNDLRPCYSQVSKSYWNKMGYYTSKDLPTIVPSSPAIGFIEPTDSRQTARNTARVALENSLMAGPDNTPQINLEQFVEALISAGWQAPDNPA